MAWLLQPTLKPGQGSLYLLLVPLPVSLEEKGLHPNNCSSKDNGTNDGDRDIGRKKPGGTEKELVGGSLILFEEIMTYTVVNIYHEVRKSEFGIWKS